MKTRHIFELEPQDTLFFRDARPMQAGAGSGGHGANWPLPSVLHEALRAALLQATGRVPAAKALRGHKNPTGKERMFVTRDFESLRTVGPFPVVDGTVYLPTPADVIPVEDGKVALMAPMNPGRGVANYPTSWFKPIGAPVRPGKQELDRWISMLDFERLLRASGMVEVPAPPKLWQVEHRIGVGIDPTTRAAAEHSLYSAEHLRPVNGMRLCLEARVAADAPAREIQALESLVGNHLTLGGESRICRIAPGVEFRWPEPPRNVTRIKWVLVTPAVFTGGWLPNWVRKENGRVWLKCGDLRRLPNEDRKTWRERVRRLPEIKARLIAVCSGKPVAFSGWDLTGVTGEKSDAGAGAPKATRLAVPPGSVYYFEADTPEQGNALVQALHGRTLSDFYGEKGMGLGFCGQWEWMEMEFA